jgi:hypothetical protein
MPRPHALHRRASATLAAAAAAALLAIVALAGPGASATAQTGTAVAGSPTSSCFGAAARDPAKPCRDAALRLSVFPLPEDAILEPNARCTPVGQTTVLLPCAFGVPKEKAKDVIALVGDSHASHWRAAVEVVSQTRGWRGISITRSSCPFSQAVAVLEGVETKRCRTWNREVLAWFRAHPEVHTVFVSEHSGGKVVTAPGKGTEATQLQGYLAAWAALPATVSRIFVIRDTPRDTSRTADCVTAAVTARKPPGPACALARGRVLKPDPAAIAARRAPSRRVKLIDLSPYMCSKRLCLPVIGGALVHRDIDHLTQTFAASLGPYMARKVAALGVPGAGTVATAPAPDGGTSGAVPPGDGGLDAPG